MRCVVRPDSLERNYLTDARNAVPLIVNAIREARSYPCNNGGKNNFISSSELKKESTDKDEDDEYINDNEDSESNSSNS